MEFFAGAFLQADGVAKTDNHFGSGDVFGVDDLGFADEADAVARYGDGGGFGGEERDSSNIISASHSFFSMIPTFSTTSLNAVIIHRSNFEYADDINGVMLASNTKTWMRKISKTVPV